MLDTRAVLTVATAGGEPRRFATRTVLALAFAIALQGALAAGAWAEAPEFGRCVKQTGGIFANAGCTEARAATPSYEWEPGPGPNARFTQSISGTRGFKWKLASNDEGNCTGESATGEYTGAKTVGHVLIVLTGCEWGFPEYRSPCETITLSPMRGTLGVYALGGTQATNKLGIQLTPENGSRLAEFNCGKTPTLYQWRGGSVIGTIPADKMLAKLALAYHQKHGPGFYEEKQIPANFLGEAPNPLEATNDSLDGERQRIFAPMGWQVSTKITNEERLEANSVL
jgi:hypothetical protein